MSKAFTKEQDGQEENETSEGQEEALPHGFKNYMTPKGADKMREELRQLLYTERPEVVKTVSWAASNGDRSENGDYIYGKRRLREIDRRVRFLTKRLESAHVIDPVTQKSDHILFGATVEVQYENGNKKTYRIVGIDETNVSQGHVSWISPLGKCLLQAKVGDTVTLQTPRGEEDLEVLNIRYEPF